MSRHAAAALIDRARLALRDKGMDDAHALTVAEVLVEADLLGHSTHGLALLPRYLDELGAGRMTPSGRPRIVSDSGSSAAWDGDYLAGPVLVRQALELCMPRARENGVATVAIARSHHIACLAAYIQAVTDQDLAAIIASSSPATASVAPFGSSEGIYSPNPIAAGWPTGGDPVIIDISSSITTNSLTSECAAFGKELPGAWMVDADGQPSADPTLLTGEPKGALLPVGGLDHGHKGFALGLLVEMLTSGLAGTGRADEPGRWGASVFVMVLDPARHGGLEAFERQTGFIADACKAARPIDPAAPVRLPGQRALERRRQQLTEGIPVEATIERLLGLAD